MGWVHRGVGLLMAELSTALVWSAPHWTGSTCSPQQSHMSQERQACRPGTLWLFVLSTTCYACLAYTATVLVLNGGKHAGPAPSGNRASGVLLGRGGKGILAADDAKHWQQMTSPPGLEAGIQTLLRELVTLSNSVMAQSVQTQ